MDNGKIGRRHLESVSATMGFFRAPPFPWPAITQTGIPSWAACADRLFSLNLFGRIYRDVSFSVRSPPSNCLLCCLPGIRTYLMMLCFSMTGFSDGGNNGIMIKLLWLYIYLQYHFSSRQQLYTVIETPSTKMIWIYATTCFEYNFVHVKSRKIKLKTLCSRKIERWYLYNRLSF